MTYDYSALTFGILCCFCIRFLYEIVDWYLYRRYPLYVSLERHRKMYVQKNMVKSFMLACMLPPSVLFVVYPILNENVWPNDSIHYFAVAYGANDFVGLLCVDRLPHTTRIHHIICTCLVLTSLSLNFQISPIGQSMFVYTFFAASAYIVNLHLSVRWLFPRGELKKLGRIAALIYISTCSMSWSWHLYWIYHSELLWYYYLYIALMLCIVRDDIILMRWLTTI